MMRNTKLLPLWLFLAALIVFLARLPQWEVLMIDTRFGLFVREMGIHGLGPYPQLYGQFYPDYTSIPTLFSYWAARVFGGVNQLTLSLPSVIAAALLVAFIGWFGQKTRSTRYGLVAALLAFCSFEFLNIARITSLDLYPAVAAALSFGAVWLGCERKQRRWFWVLALAFPAGYLARGPIGVVIPTATAIAAALAYRQFKTAFRIGVFGAAVITLLMWLWIHFAVDAGGEMLLNKVAEMQVSGRMERGKPFWYYFLDAAGSYAIVYPMGLIVIGSYFYFHRKHSFDRPANDNDLLVQGLGLWMLLILGGLSVPGTKHLRYVVGVIPPAALLAAQILENPEHRRWFGFLRLWFFRLALWMPPLLLAAFPITAFILTRPAVAERLGGAVALPWFLWMLVLAAVVLANHQLRSPHYSERHRQLVRLLGVAVSFLAIQIGLIEPISQTRESSTAFVAAAEAFRPGNQAIYFYELGPDGDENKYLFHVAPERYFIPGYLLRTPPADPGAFTYAAPVLLTRNWQEFPSGLLLVVRLDRWRKNLPPEAQAAFDVLQTGKLGHRQVALLRKK